MTDPQKLWEPSQQAIERAQITEFAQWIVRRLKLDLNSYPDFYRWTVDNPEEFWSSVWEWCGVIASRKGSTVLVDGDKMPGAKWFPEARLYFAENLLRRGDRGDALVFWDETGFRHQPFALVICERRAQTGAPHNRIGRCSRSCIVPKNADCFWPWPSL